MEYVGSWTLMCRLIFIPFLFSCIRSTEDITTYQKQAVAVTSESVDRAVEWLWALDRTSEVSPTATCEAIVRAVNDVNVRGFFSIKHTSSYQIITFDLGCPYIFIRTI